MTLIQKLAPTELVTKLAGPAQPFLSLYGSAPLLCVALAGGHELEAGLVGSTDPDASHPTRTLGFHTVAADAVSVRGPANHGFSASALAERLGAARHFVLSLTKRSEESISEERISVGRARNKDIVLRDGSVSKFHAWFEVDDGTGAVQLADAGSKNGTSIDGERLPLRAVTPVPYGAALKFGNVSAFVCEAAVLWDAFHRR